MEKEADTGAWSTSESIAAAIAHEVNNLLTPVIGLADLLQHTDGDDEVREQLIERAVERCQRAVSICTLLVETAKHGEGLPPTCSLPLVIAATAQTARSRAESAHVRLNCSFDEPATLGVPSAVAEHVLLNLVLNAVAASRPGGSVTVTARYTPASAWQAAAWTIDVLDQGRGLEARSVAAINDGGLPAGSSGIGLAVVRLLCERWGGHLSVESELGVGSTFHVKLPAA